MDRELLFKINKYKMTTSSESESDIDLSNPIKRKSLEETQKIGSKPLFIYTLSDEKSCTISSLRFLREFKEIINKGNLDTCEYEGTT